MMKVLSKGRQIYVKLAGRIGPDEANDLERSISGIPFREIDVLILDMSEATSLTSAFIGKLLALRNKTIPQRVGISLINVSSNIFTMLKLTKLNQVFDIKPV